MTCELPVLCLHLPVQACPARAALHACLVVADALSCACQLTEQASAAGAVSYGGGL